MQKYISKTLFVASTKRVCYQLVNFVFMLLLYYKLTNAAATASKYRERNCGVVY